MEVIPDPAISYVGFVSMDEAVAVCGEVTDADIVVEVLNNNVQAEDGASGDEEDNSSVQERPIPSAAEAMDHIQELTNKLFQAHPDIFSKQECGPQSGKASNSSSLTELNVFHQFTLPLLENDSVTPASGSVEGLVLCKLKLTEQTCPYPGQGKLQTLVRKLEVERINEKRTAVIPAGAIQISSQGETVQGLHTLTMTNATTAGGAIVQYAQGQDGQFFVPGE
ncbi:unnamed protein product, partial [Timema podura]|nr:unnamed protein product [Timema podura]